MLNNNNNNNNNNNKIIIKITIIIIIIILLIYGPFNSSNILVNRFLTKEPITLYM